MGGRGQRISYARWVCECGGKTSGNNQSRHRDGRRHREWVDAERAHEAAGEIRCRGCGTWGVTVYCAACAKDARCPHGNRFGDCNPCDVAGDLAFDSARETAPGRYR